MARIQENVKDSPSSLQQQSHDATKNDHNTIQIPTSSFTAFRLLYATSAEVSHLASTVFLGKVPDTWIKLSNAPSLFSNSTSHKCTARLKIPATTLSLKKRMNKLTGLGSSPIENYVTENTQENISEQRLPFDAWEETSSKSFLSDETVLRNAVTNSTASDDMSFDICQEDISPANVNISTGNNDEPKHELKLLMDSQCGAYPTKDKPTFHVKKSIPYLASSELFGEHKKSSMKERSLGESSSMRYKSERADDKKLKVQFANPQPEEKTSNEILQQEYVLAEREHYRVVRKMQTLARKSKGRAQLSSSKLKLKIVDNILQKRKIGEIVRVDKMLVMIRKVSNISTVLSFTERSDADSTIQDHWREYFVVLRNTGSHVNPLHVLLFERNKGKNFEEKPEHSFDINEDIRADFFSLTDKTISIANLVEDGLKIFIMNMKYTTVAFKWLYMIKEVLKEDFFSTVKIDIAGKRTQIKIDVPRPLLDQSLAGAELLKLHEQPTGYAVESDVLFSYLSTKIGTYMRAFANRSNSASEWLEQNSTPAFCFKYYDRLEWIPSDGKSLVLQSQLLGEGATLEYRQMTKIPLSVKDTKGRVISRPTSIEGFLSRITNTMGKEYSKFRSFYKIQYFFSSENILFFSSLLRGVPPSPQNQLLKEGVDKGSLCNLLPDVYPKTSFELDDHEHISWLSKADFEKFDNEAVEEFSRKLRQIVGARAMVDICMISAVKAIPFEKIQARHLYFQLYLWYSSPVVLDDMNIMDCGFEIELFDGSQLKLLAPLRNIRDEWVERLNELAIYWRSHMAKLSLAETSSKLKNMAKLRLGDYVDSNLSFGHDSLEVGKSFANDITFTSSGLAMSTCVLCSGYLYQKQKKHSSFSRYFVVLCSGYLLIYSLFKRSKVTGVQKDTPYYERYMTIPISECYVYSESSTQLDLVASQKVKSPGECDLPRIYPDGWRSSEEEFMRCFSIWFGGKRALRHSTKRQSSSTIHGKVDLKNPGMMHMTRKLGVTGKILVFLARSRQEREHWVYNILQEINRFSAN
ncbi:hypothetical protein METBIDRAFT_42780 [Metschnikowia bicuspidata var. bicuspidata NRRL YB-4993]|uniref:PH domain-containing protein n=1 Tax=Metschnikowia bicuspidata var. bicuspidata NRRL YB-4993 TaxID=869754 RepID=A0A1A0HB09_9ASCO|nr:hypothetical protein METBIDRAFT_42780 [Metschnikowia bicuspidata var. bicuspidata NRRL YB-4993]OBA21175.1 hypothetical protein METBIDRAFT_42780 [Metschnikowia bicuspidata var. bicuspidata NRRL YB-4993]